MAKSVKLYEAVRGDEVISGTAHEVADQIGASSISICSSCTRGYLLFGWRIREAGVRERHVQYAAYHVSDMFREDPVIGDAEEVAEVIGIGNPIYIQTLARTGKMTKHGYYVERLPEGGDADGKVGKIV